MNTVLISEILICANTMLWNPCASRRQRRLSAAASGPISCVGRARPSATIAPSTRPMRMCTKTRTAPLPASCRAPACLRASSIAPTRRSSTLSGRLLTRAGGNCWRAFSTSGISCCCQSSSGLPSSCRNRLIAPRISSSSRPTTMAPSTATTTSRARSPEMRRPSSGAIDCTSSNTSRPASRAGNRWRSMTSSKPAATSR